MDIEKLVAAIVSGALALAPVVINYFKGRTERLDLRRKELESKQDEIVQDAHAEYARKKQELDDCENRIEAWRNKYNDACAQVAELKANAYESEARLKRLQSDLDALKK